MAPLLAFLLLTTVFLTACHNQQPHNDVVAQVSDDSMTLGITEQDFLYAYEFTPRRQDSLKGSEARRAFLETLVQEKLLALEGFRRGLDQDERVRIPLRWYKEKAVRQALYRKVVRDRVVLSEAELRQGFLRLKTRVRVRHLPARTLEAARALRRRLQAGETFEQLAREVFKDTTLAQNGGDLGYIRLGDLDEALEDAAFSLRVGEISEPIKSRWAYHILKAEDRRTQAILTETEYQRQKARVARILRRRKEARLADAFIKQFMNPRRVRVYGPSVVFLVEQSKAILNSGERLLPNQLPPIRDAEIGTLTSRLGDHLDQVLVQFEGGQWTIGDFLDKLRAVHPDARPVMTSKTNLKDVVARMVRDEFLLQEGYRHGLQNSSYVREEVRRWKQTLVAEHMRSLVVDTVTVSEVEAQRFYERNRHRYTLPVRVRLQEIFVRERALALDLRRRIENGEDFAALAAQHSLRTWAARRGGDFGFMGLGMYGELGRRALRAPVGKLVGPVEMKDAELGPGFSLFQVTERREGRFKTFGEAEKEVERDALEEKRQHVLRNFIVGLRQRYRVRVDEEALARLQTTDELAKGSKVQMFVHPRF